MLQSPKPKLKQVAFPKRTNNIYFILLFCFLVLQIEENKTCEICKVLKQRLDILCSWAKLAVPGATIERHVACVYALLFSKLLLVCIILKHPLHQLKSNGIFIAQSYMLILFVANISSSKYCSIHF